MTFEELIGLIEGQNKQAVARFMQDSDNSLAVETSPGSRYSHHNWRGGYKEHIRQTMAIAKDLYALFQDTDRIKELPEQECFDLSDALIVMFLHDIEKPFMYKIDEFGYIETINKMTKCQRKVFRQNIIDDYGFVISPAMENALLYVEGVRDDDYLPGERADWPLAAICHAADNLSARGFYSYRG